MENLGEKPDVLSDILIVVAQWGKTKKSDVIVLCNRFTVGDVLCFNPVWINDGMCKIITTHGDAIEQYNTIKGCYEAIVSTERRSQRQGVIAWKLQTFRNELMRQLSGRDNNVANYPFPNIRGNTIKLLIMNEEFISKGLVLIDALEKLLCASGAKKVMKLITDRNLTEIRATGSINAKRVDEPVGV